MRIVIFLTLFRVMLFSQQEKPSADFHLYQKASLIPDTAAMDYAWDIPKNPLNAVMKLPDSIVSPIRDGFQMFMNTPKFAKRFSGGTMSCNNCHPNGGQRDKAMPLVGVSNFFPEYNKRSGRSFSLEDRIIGCFLRSMNATGSRSKGVVIRHESETATATLSPQSKEVRSLAAYIAWLSSTLQVDDTIPWRGHNVITKEKIISVEKLNPQLGKKIYMEKCGTCHGIDGQGVAIGDKKPGPLWGPRSWNDGAGVARTYTLAGFIRYVMPYLAPGSLTDEEAQHLAAYITSKPRPKFPFKDKDYLKEKIPVDAVYYTQLYKKNPLVRNQKSKIIINN